MDVELKRSEDGRPFVWVVFLGEGDQAKLLFLSDENSQRGSFIPVFASKEDGLVGLGRLPQTQGQKAELEAMALDDVSAQAREHGLGVVILNKEGQVLGQLKAEDQSQ